MTNNPYRNMIMDMMRMNQGHVGQCPIVNEEPNTDAIRFFWSFKRFWWTIMDSIEITINYKLMDSIEIDRMDSLTLSRELADVP
jgi:hypothetical protein